MVAVLEPRTTQEPRVGALAIISAGQPRKAAQDSVVIALRRHLENRAEAVESVIQTRPYRA